jgi:sulfur-carrier protein
MIIIKFFSLIRMNLGISDVEIDTDKVSLHELLLQTEHHIKKSFLDQLLNKDLKVLPGTIILINGRNIVHLEGVQTLVNSGDEISIFPPGGGG